MKIENAAAAQRRRIFLTSLNAAAMLLCTTTALICSKNNPAEMGIAYLLALMAALNAFFTTRGIMSGMKQYRSPADESKPARGAENEN